MPQMHILRLLAARRAAASERDDDEGPFFDLDFSSCSVRASSYSSGSLSLSDSDSDDDLDFTISLHRTSSASEPRLKFRASEPPARANSLPSTQRHGHGDRKRAITLRTLSFGARKPAPLNSLPRSSSGRHSFARSSTSSARSFRLFADSPRPHPHAAQDDAEAERSSSSTSRRAVPSRDVFRRCLAKISRRLRTASASPRGVVDARGLRRLRKCRSASSRDDDSAVEKQDGIAGAIAHCKDSLHRVASECDSPLLRSRSESDPGKCEAAA